MFLIAEIGQAHDGSLGFAHSFIDALSQTGVDAIKWQTHIAHAESSEQEPFRVKFSYEDETRYDYWKRMEFSFNQWVEIKNHCEQAGLEFISSPFSNAAVDLLEKLDVKKYKIGSGEVSNHLILDKITKTGKEIILSSGMSDFSDLDKSVELIKSSGNPLSILQCTTSYPTQPDQWGLNVMQELSRRYDVPVGFSDHSGDVYACLAAAALGAEILEFHATFDKQMFGPDSRSSLTIEQIKTLTEGVGQIVEARENPIDKSDNSQFSELKSIFEKSLAVNKDLPAGHELRLEDLEGKKPANEGISASNYKSVVGKKLSRELKAWSFLKNSDISE